VHFDGTPYPSTLVAKRHAIIVSNLQYVVALNKYRAFRALSITNPINRDTGTRWKFGEACTIGSSRYKNLKLKKKEEKKRSYAVEWVLLSG
jgi:hypothetical protein